MNDNTPNMEDIKQQLNEFMHGIDALMLATVNEDGRPQASYAPYVEYEGSFYIFISGLASHTENLQLSGVASVLFMENQTGGHAHTRKRLSCQCKATEIEREDGLFEPMMQSMENRFGSLVSTLRGLADFRLFQLKPEKGNFVAGFGQAFEVEFPLGGGIRHKNPT